MERTENIQQDNIKQTAGPQPAPANLTSKTESLQKYLPPILGGLVIFILIGASYMILQNKLKTVQNKTLPESVNTQKEETKTFPTPPDSELKTGKQIAENSKTEQTENQVSSEKKPLKKLPETGIVIWPFTVFFLFLGGLGLKLRKLS